MTLKFVRFSFLSLLITTSVSFPALARKKRVVVLPFVGPAASTARRGVMQAIRRRVRLLSFTKYRQEAERLKVEVDSADGIVATCGQLRCDAMVAARVRLRRRVRYLITLTVVGGNGAVVKSIQASGRGRRGLSRAASRLGRQALRLIARAKAAPRAAPVPLVQDRQPEVRVEEPPPPPRRAPPHRPVAEEPGYDDDGDEAYAEEQGGGEVPPLVRRRPGLPEPKVEPEGEGRSGIFEVSAGVGFATRSFTLTSPDQTNRSYSPGAYSEFTLAAKVFPLAPFIDGFARNIGLAASYSHHIAVATTLPPNRNQTTSCMFDEDVSTSSQQLLLDLTLRWPLLGEPWSPVVLLDLGFGMRDFDLGANNVLPSFNYKFLRFGLGGKVDLGTPWIALSAGGDLRPLLQVGQETVDALGERSGGIGWAFHVGLSGKHSSGLFYFATFEYSGYAMKFKGLPEELDRGDCFPDVVEDPDGGTYSGSDSFLRFWGGLGYAL